MSETLNSIIDLTLGNVPDIDISENPHLYEALLRLHQAIEILVDYYDEVGGIYVTIGDSQTITGAKTFSALATFNAAITANGLVTFNGGISVPVEDWHEVGAVGEPAFETGWVNYGTGYESAAFYKDPWGVVHIKGLIKSGTITDTAFTLPIGYRPAEHVYKGTYSNSAFGGLTIQSSGLVIPYTGSNVWFSINCSFRAA